MMKPSPRSLAVEILTRIDQGGAYAEPLLDVTLSKGPLTNPQDRALLTELVYGTLRMRGSLDWIIAELYRGDAGTLEPTVRNILRTGLYQLRYTDRIPSFAAVNEAVGIARNVSPAAAGLVNAILRNATRRGKDLAWPDIAKNPQEAIAALHSHSPWLVKRLLAQFGTEQTVEICRANNAIPPVTLRVNTLRASREVAASAMAEEGIRTEQTAFSPDGLIVTSPAPNLRETAPYREGWIRVQDEASQLIAHLVAPRPGEQILDLCAGVGGKTLHMAALMQNRGRIAAVDLQSEKLRMLRTEAGRLGVTILETRQGDAGRLANSLNETFDRVLLDAPCSGLGTLRRNPEIRWRLSPSDIRRHLDLQRELLTGAAQWVKPGGRLIYSVCTATTEENEVAVSHLLKNRPDFRLLRPDHLAPAVVDPEGYLRTSPVGQGMDGFFGALLIRRA